MWWQPIVLKCPLDKSIDKNYHSLDSRSKYKSQYRMYCVTISSFYWNCMCCFSATSIPFSVPRHRVYFDTAVKIRNSVKISELWRAWKVADIFLPNLYICFCVVMLMTKIRSHYVADILLPPKLLCYNLADSRWDFYSCRQEPYFGRNYVGPLFWPKISLSFILAESQLIGKGTFTMDGKVKHSPWLGKVLLWYFSIM